MKKSGKWLWLAIYVIAVLICIMLIYVAPSIMGLFDSTYVAEYGSVDVTDEVDAYFFRDDTLYISDSSSEVNRLAEEGQLVKGKSRIVELTGTGNEVFDSKYADVINTLGDKARTADEGKADAAGYVSYYFDGREDIFSTSNISKMTKAEVDEQGDPSIQQGPEKRCAKGDPLFKISTNGDWYLLFWVGNLSGVRYQEGSRVTITADTEGGQSHVTGEITRVRSGPNSTRVEICCDMFIKDLIRVRNAKVDITTAEATGVIVESASIIEKDGLKGVIVRDKIGQGHFKPVKIMADNGEQAAVYEDYYMDENQEFVETIKTYDEVVREPTDDEIAAAVNINDKYES